MKLTIRVPPQETVPVMFNWHRLSITGLLLVGSVSGASAQSVVLDPGKSINLYGLTITVGSTCTIAGTACSLTDNLLLEGVSTGRDTITFEVVNKTAGSNILSTTRNGSTESLDVNFTVTPNASYHGGGLVSSATKLSLTGTDECTSGNGKTCVAAKAVATLSSPFSPTSLTASLPISTSSSSVVTGNSGSSTLSPNSNTFTVSDALTLNPASANTTGFSLTARALVLQLHTVPEPASAAVLLLGLGGLARTRGRRKA